MDVGIAEDKIVLPQGGAIYFNELNKTAPEIKIGDEVYIFADTTSSSKRVGFYHPTTPIPMWIFGNKITITKEILESNLLFYSDFSKQTVIQNIMITKENSKTYEPYTGRKPSPSPEYPQEIKNVGKWNPETQKYEVDIKVTNAKESWDKEQTLTLTSDRPITKWDKLVEQDGQIGWLYKSQIIDRLDGKSNKVSLVEKKGEVQHFSIEFKNTPKGDGNTDIYVDKYRAVLSSYALEEFGICCNWNDGIKYFSAPNINITNTEEFKAWLSENPLTLEYETETPEFVPLQKEEQDAIRNIKTYYPTTVITVDGGEVDPDVEVTYIADTKNYIDQKIAAINKTVVETQKALL